MTDALELVEGTIEYIEVEISATDEAGDVVDLSGETVEWAFSSGGAIDVDTLTWYSGSWRSSGEQYWARFLTGVAPIFTEGIYGAYVKIEYNSEVPIKKVGTIKVIPA